MKLTTVDVFGTDGLDGNPVAVVEGGGHLTTDEMMRITRWFNLSETTFLLPPDDPQADYRVRIFTLERELPFAGHPTLGTCHAWLSAGNSPRRETEIVQQCAAGLITIRRDDGRLAFAAPDLVRSGAPSNAELDDALRFLALGKEHVVDAAWVDNGPGWLGIRLASAQAVLALRPATGWASRIEIGVVGPHAKGEDAEFELRAFFSNHLGAVVEDPVTGSLNASIAQWLFEAGIAREAYVARQGTCVGRNGRIHLSRDERGRVWVGGRTQTHVEGQMTIG